MSPNIWLNNVYDLSLWLVAKIMENNPQITR